MDNKITFKKTQYPFFASENVINSEYNFVVNKKRKYEKKNMINEIYMSQFTGKRIYISYTPPICQTIGELKTKTYFAGEINITCEGKIICKTDILNTSLLKTLHISYEKSSHYMAESFDSNKESGPSPAKIKKVSENKDVYTPIKINGSRTLLKNISDFSIILKNIFIIKDEDSYRYTYLIISENNDIIGYTGILCK